MFHVEHWLRATPSIEHQRIRRFVRIVSRLCSDSIKRMGRGPLEGWDERGRDLRAAWTPEQHDDSARREKCLKRRQHPRLGPDRTQRDDIVSFVKLRPGQELLEARGLDLDILSRAAGRPLEETRTSSPSPRPS